MPFRSTRWSRRAGTILSASCTPRTQARNKCASSARFESTSAAPTKQQISPDEPVKETRSSALTRKSPIGQSHKGSIVDPNSLRNTLEAHREANRASVIVKIAGKGFGRQKLVLSSTEDQQVQPERNQARIGTWTWHYKPAPGSGKRKRKRLTRPEQCTNEVFLAQWAPASGLRYMEKYPWMSHMNPRAQIEVAGRPAGIEQLSTEIDAFYDYSRPNAQEKKAAELALQEISATIREVDQDLQIDVVGSRATGLAMPTSDIDLNISTSSTSGSTLLIKSRLSRVFSHLLATSRKNGLFRSINTRFRPAVPLVTGRHASTHLEFQVQSTVDVFLSMQNTISFINEYATLPKLFLLLKQMLTMRGLCSGQAQGLTSYPLLVMIVAALKFSEGKLDRRDTAAHLLFFLDMYSDIDFNTTAISFSPLQYVVKRHPHSATLPDTRSAALTPDNHGMSKNEIESATQDIDARRRFATIKPDAEFLMSLQDPADLRNDLGKAAWRIREVQTVFIRAREELKAGLKAWDDGEDSGKQEPLLAPCVGGDYRIFENARHHLAASVT